MDAELSVEEGSQGSHELDRGVVGVKCMEWMWSLIAVRMIIRRAVWMLATRVVVWASVWIIAQDGRAQVEWVDGWPEVVAGTNRVLECMGIVDVVNAPGRGFGNGGLCCASAVVRQRDVPEEPLEFGSVPFVECIRKLVVGYAVVEVRVRWRSGGEDARVVTDSDWKCGGAWVVGVVPV